MKPNVLLSLIMLTQLNGQPVWVESTQVQIIRMQSHECAQGTGAVIRIGTVNLCVKETADQVREKIKTANGKR